MTNRKIKTALSNQPFFIDAKAIKRASSIYRAINHSLRLQVIEIVHKAGSINVTPIIEQLKLEQSLVSAQLKILRDAKLVITEKKGSNIFYSINYPEINRITLLAEKLIPYRTNSLNFLQSADRKLILKSKEDTVTFTPTELKVIHLVCNEFTSEEIAEKLGIGKRTVEEHRSNIIKKMKVRNSVGILMYAVKNKIFKI